MQDFLSNNAGQNFGKKIYVPMHWKMPVLINKIITPKLHKLLNEDWTSFLKDQFFITILMHEKGMHVDKVG